ncbi:MAG: hypothetical protein JO359_15185 [Candidatus Eremiobacteraeota bacterium]|nr:hypothetical protein [Candidatus Eremiobacteraeota bacterium]
MRAWVRRMKSHPAVRNLLAKIKEPHRLECDPLGVALRDAKRLRTVREALLETIDAALRAQDPRFARVVERCDLQGAKVVVVANELHITPRQLFRYRRSAVDAIAVAIREALEGRRAPLQPVVPPRPGEIWRWSIESRAS